MAYDTVVRERTKKIQALEERFKAIFQLFSKSDFMHPITGRTIVAALENIRVELKNLL